MAEEEKVTLEFIGRTLADMQARMATKDDIAELRAELRKVEVENNERMTRFEAALFRFEDSLRTTREAMQEVVRTLRDHQRV